MKISKAILVGYFTEFTGESPNPYWMIPLYENEDSYYYHILDENNGKIADFEFAMTKENFQLKTNFINPVIKTEIKIGDPAVFVWECPGSVVIVTSKEGLSNIKYIAEGRGYNATLKILEKLYKQLLNKKNKIKIPFCFMDGIFFIQKNKLLQYHRKNL